MSITTVTKRLASIQSNISDIQAAFYPANQPNKIRTGHLPCFLNLPGESEYGHFSSGYGNEARIYRMLFLHSPIARPVDVALHAGDVEPFFARTQAAFAAAVLLDSLAGVEFAQIQRDSGLIAIEHGGILYAGAEFQIAVSETLDDATDA